MPGSISLAVVPIVTDDVMDSVVVEVVTSSLVISDTVLVKLEVSNSKLLVETTFSVVGIVEDGSVTAMVVVGIVATDVAAVVGKVEGIVEVIGTVVVTGK